MYSCIHTHIFDGDGSCGPMKSLALGRSRTCSSLSNGCNRLRRRLGFGFPGPGYSEIPNKKSSCNKERNTNRNTDKHRISGIRDVNNKKDKHSINTVVAVMM